MDAGETKYWWKRRAGVSSDQGRSYPEAFRTNAQKDQKRWRLDILVNNAGIHTSKTVWKNSDEQIRNV
ncbi:hypothetical protein EJ377_18825 [Chryseobacterium arthrosphaerae]|uniref:Uncharacterized protein n=1 Tax=Chryseobacterium arthrosphaerae TaxID=651561 RepID=A0A3S0N588_9FLAO|nr:hypothetical protein EJ377_18825 [Chryseobacterium arthrosphaerae]